MVKHQSINSFIIDYTYTHTYIYIYIYSYSYIYIYIYIWLYIDSSRTDALKWLLLIWRHIISTINYENKVSSYWRVLPINQYLLPNPSMALCLYTKWWWMTNQVRVWSTSINVAWQLLASRDLWESTENRSNGWRRRSRWCGWGEGELNVLRYKCYVVICLYHVSMWIDVFYNVSPNLL